MAADAEQLEKLKGKYNQLKQANAVLKKGLIEKQEEHSRLEQSLTEKDATIRQQLEEIDHLQFQNNRLTKQIGTLNGQVEELQKQKGGGAGWSVGSIIPGRAQSEAIQKAEGEIHVLRDELMIKIQENEDLHMQMYEAKRQADEGEERLREQMDEVKKDLGDRGTELTSEKEHRERLFAETQEQSRRISDTGAQLSAAEERERRLQSSLEEERLLAMQRLGALRRELAKRVPFDDSKHEGWNLWNAAPRRGRRARRRGEAAAQLQACVAEACQHNSAVLRAWDSTFGISPSEESQSRVRVRCRMSEALQKLAGQVEESLPLLVGDLFVTHPKTAPSPRKLREGVRALLTAHRRWVTYQSLLLLHDPSGGRGSRGPGDAADALVDCLWRLHHGVRVLLRRLQLLAYVSALASRGGSAAHFALARGTVDLQRDASAAGQSPERPPLQVAVPAQQLVECLRGSLRDVLQCWEGVGRCLSSWASTRQGLETVELLEALHSFRVCVTDRVVPAVDRAVGDLPQSFGGAVACGGPLLLGLVPASRSREHELAVVEGKTDGEAGATTAVAVPPGSEYLIRTATHLLEAPGGIGYEAAVRTRALAGRLTATKARLNDEVKEQARRLQDAAGARAALSDELRALQDSHALLRSNLQVLEAGAAPAAPRVEKTAEKAPTQVDLIEGSRQRALLEGLPITAQESSALRQRGFFVDVLTLAPGEERVAGGPPPDLEAFEAWEVSVRRVYEQHVRNLQGQMRAADGKAMELHLSSQQHLDLLREREEAKQKLRDEVNMKQRRLSDVNEDMATLTRNYTSQIAMLTEHTCTLSERLSEKDAGLASLQAHRVLCGHCGMWNTMGKLLSSEAGGMCQTCKEKVLSSC